MRIALVHDFLSQRGGAERVVLHLARALVDPVIVTSLYAPEETYPEFAQFPVWAERQVSGPAARRFRSHVLSYPGIFRSMDLREFDVVVISSSSFAHHIGHSRSAVYWHSPPRFLYHPNAYFPWRPAATLASAATAPLRPRDRRAARAHVLHAANSQRTASRLRQVYQVDAPVLHPPLDTSGLPLLLSPVEAPPKALVVSRLLPYKRVDLAIAACRRLQIPLTVVGDGPDRDRLERLADSSVTFQTALADHELAAIYARHAVVICPGQEDFGYVPAEAAYSGRPVVAAAGGGAEETVLHGSSGVLVDGADPQVWANALEWTLSRRWDPEQLRGAASRFSAAVFAAGLARWLAPLADPSQLLRPEDPAALPLLRSA